MKTKLPLCATLSFAVATILTFTNCSSEPKHQGPNMGGAEPQDGQGSATVSVQPGEPGGLVVQTYQETARVTGIDRAARTLTLLTSDGNKATVKAGPEVANFNQIEVGDQVKATLTEQLMVFVRSSNEPPRHEQTTGVALAPLGAKPGVVMADTIEMTGKVTALDPQHHTATVQLPDGRSKTFNVRKDVDLTKRHVGDEVVFRSTQSMAIKVEKP